jgi:hypothetical protein
MRKTAGLCFRHDVQEVSYLSRIHERTIALRFLGIILRVLRLEVSVNNIYITNKFQTTFARGALVEVTVNSKEKNSRLLFKLGPSIRPLV